MGEGFGDAVLAVLGAVLLLQGLLPLRTGRPNFGLAICTIAGAICLIFSFWGSAIRRAVPAWVLGSAATLCALAAALFFVVSVFLRVRGGNDSVCFDESALVVLGASVHRGQLSVSLRNRLDGALRYAVKNPKAFIVVSGGKIGAETVAEAEAMQRYLIAHGLDRGRILAEDRSKNTRENFLFSASLLRANNIDTRNMAFLTSRFHVYRAMNKARLAGLAPRSLGAPVPIFAVLPCYLRESLAVLRLWTLGY